MELCASACKYKILKTERVLHPFISIDAHMLKPSRLNSWIVEAETLLNFPLGRGNWILKITYSKQAYIFL
jgi:hypothetical protein